MERYSIPIPVYFPPLLGGPHGPWPRNRDFFIYILKLYFPYGRRQLRSPFSGKVYRTFSKKTWKISWKTKIQEKSLSDRFSKKCILFWTFLPKGFWSYLPWKKESSTLALLQMREGQGKIIQKMQVLSLIVWHINSIIIYK